MCVSLGFHDVELWTFESLQKMFAIRGPLLLHILWNHTSAGLPQVIDSDIVSLSVSPTRLVKAYKSLLPRHLLLFVINLKKYQVYLGLQNHPE